MTALPAGSTSIADIATRLDEIGQLLFNLHPRSVTLDVQLATTELLAYKAFLRKLTYAGWGPDHPVPADESPLTPEQQNAAEDLETAIRHLRLADAAGTLVDRGCMDPAVVFIADGTSWETALEMCVLLGVRTALSPSTP